MSGLFDGAWRPHGPTFVAVVVLAFSCCGSASVAARGATLAGFEGRGVAGMSKGVLGMIARTVKVNVARSCKRRIVLGEGIESLQSALVASVSREVRGSTPAAIKGKLQKLIQKIVRREVMMLCGPMGRAGRDLSARMVSRRPSFCLTWRHLTLDTPARR